MCLGLQRRRLQYSGRFAGKLGLPASTLRKHLIGALPIEPVVWTGYLVCTRVILGLVTYHCEILKTGNENWRPKNRSWIGNGASLSCAPMNRNFLMTRKAPGSHSGKPAP